jgi:hypothetical protein
MGGAMKRIFWLMVIAFSLTSCGGEAFSYKLRNPQNSGEFSTLHTMPDGDLLVLIKQIEQPKQTWKLRRIAGWDSSQPHEDALDVDVGPNDEILDWSLQRDRADRNDQLLMDRGGNYLVVRRTEGADEWNWNRNRSAKPPRSVLNIIDLHGFKLLSRVVVTDPLQAAGDMGFSPTGALVVSGLQDYSSATVGGVETDTGRYVVETLSLPGLKPETVCSYSVVTHPSPQTPVSPKERGLIETRHRLEMRRKANQDQAAEELCKPKLGPLGFSSLKDVRESLSYSGGQEYIADHVQKIPPQSPWGCEFEDLSGNLKYALLDCDESRVQLAFFFWYRGFRVFRLDDGAQVMDLKMSHSPQFSGVLAISGGITYVVLLRNGEELEGYRVP